MATQWALPQGDLFEPSPPVSQLMEAELQQVARRVSRTPCRLRRHPRKPRRREVQPVDEGVNEPNRIVPPT
jgi:hypothetical protein